MSDYEPDDSLEAEGIPDMFESPPGRDIETNEEAFMAPRDHPIAAGVDPAYAVTAAEDRAHESVAERAAREEPEVTVPEVGESSRAPHLFSPDSGVDTSDVTPEEVGVLAEDDGEGLTAEETAVRVTSEDVADDVDPAVEAAEYLEGR